jgi:hypothetical protein
MASFRFVGGFMLTEIRMGCSKFHRALLVLGSFKPEPPYKFPLNFLGTFSPSMEGLKLPP